jgi:RNA polymerase sigma-70 factor (ECF subfamily)
MPQAPSIVPAERDLVAAFLRGDEAAFRSLYRAHAPALYRLAWRLLDGSVADAEDMVQETWLRAARGLGGFGWRSTLRTWLVGVAIRCCRERQRERAAARGGPAARQPAPEPSAPAPREVDRLDLEAAVAALPPRAREVFLLHDVEGWAHAEVASLLGIEEGTSKSQLHHARRALAARLEPTGAKR